MDNAQNSSPTQTRLANRDYTLILDKSGSMATSDCANGKSRWDAAKESALAMAEACNKLDPDGITVVPFSGSFTVYENVGPQQVYEIFEKETPMGGTMLAPVLKARFDHYNRMKAAGEAKPNGEILLVVTDGQPEDESQVAKEIVKFTKTLDHDDEYGIEFIQIGRDQHATAFLNRLDDHLQQEGAKFDIVNAKTLDEVEKVGLTQTLIDSLDA